MNKTMIYKNEEEGVSMVFKPDYEMEKDRRIYLDSEVDDTCIEIQKLIMKWNIEDKQNNVKDHKPIWIYIMSYGGSADAMWMLIDTIKASEIPVYTVNVGVAASAASLIFMAGTKRYAFKNSVMVIHEGSAEISGDATKVVDASDRYKKNLQKMKDFILANTEIPKAHLNKKRSNDWFLDSDYCLEHKVCDKIIESISEVI